MHTARSSNGLMPQRRQHDRMILCGMAPPFASPVKNQNPLQSPEGRFHFIRIYSRVRNGSSLCEYADAETIWPHGALTAQANLRDHSARILTIASVTRVSSSGEITRAGMV